MSRNNREDDWPPTLIKRLTTTFSSQAETSPLYVSVLVHEERHPFGRDTLRILGVFESVFLANQKAIEILLSFEKHKDWSNFVEQTPSNLGLLEQGSKVRWEVSDWRELSLMAVNGKSGDKYKVYVQHQVIHRSHESTASEYEDTDVKN
ncbi:uncharacterized protein N7483_007447 [Penicillium malachiteum]|uniref:uncharacterized protein n=1 Tax=Penicillium malachiteum TaxID=1324776 RepID=UPI002546820F|nr:uncharacterized protein N7483_007447 [Penicillium malachiteum]KAJ5726090.1 hypothetical protein N7483_007447 [Penicillium malachiteum]